MFLPPTMPVCSPPSAAQFVRAAPTPEPHRAAPAGVVGLAKIFPHQPLVCNSPPDALASSQSLEYQDPVSKSSHHTMLGSVPQPGSDELKNIVLAAEAPPAATRTAFDVTPASDAAVKLMVRDPAAPVTDRSVKVATPLALVVAVAAPPSVPPPVAIVAVTTTPDWLTLLLEASRSWTAGCVAKDTPLCAEVDGCVAMNNRVAAPPPTFAATGDSSPQLARTTTVSAIEPMGTIRQRCRNQVFILPPKNPMKVRR